MKSHQNTLRFFGSFTLLAGVATFVPLSGSGQSGRRQPPSSPVIVTTAPLPPGRNRQINQEGDGTSTQSQVTPSTASSTSSGATQKGSGTRPKTDGDEVGTDDVIRVTSNLVTVPASVVDTDGRAIGNLRLEDFELQVDGQKKQISDLFKSESPVRLAMLFDNSSSLTASRELEKHAATQFFKRVMRVQDQAAIYNVYNEVVLAQPLTSNVSALVHTIESFGKPEGATSLFDAIAEASRYLYPYSGRKVILIVSDGADTTSQLDFEATLRRAQVAGCQIYVVQTGQTNNANLRDLMAERRMQEFAAQTGGAVYVPHSTSDLELAFTQIAADLAQQYVLSYYPNDDARDGKFRVIGLRVPSHPNARIRARKGYYSPKDKRS
jgi:Ca-activated chloride channel family protein